LRPQQTQESRLNAAWQWTFRGDRNDSPGVSAASGPTSAPRGAAAGNCFLDGDNLRREGQLEGIAKAKAAGIYKGRPASIDAVQVRAIKAQGLGASEIAKALKIGRASVYRILETG
jgi:helix-turn-helix resolvase-like protein